jgi:hypothetical protein
MILPPLIFPRKDAKKIGGIIRNIIARNTIAAYIIYTTCNGLSNNFIIMPVSVLV